MPTNQSNFNISTALPLQFEKVKISLKENYGILWTDFLVLCSLAELGKSELFIKTSDIIKYTGRNRGWIYLAIKRLIQKELVDCHYPKKVKDPREIWITGMGHFLLKNVFRAIRLNEFQNI